MATQARLLASRRNGAKSHGPITDAGKAIASRNSVKHGLLSQTEVLLPDETEDDLKAFTDALRADLQPEGAVEEMLFERVVSCGWRLKRAARIEASVLTWYTADEQNQRAMKRGLACFGEPGQHIPCLAPSGPLRDRQALAEAIVDETNSRVQRDAPATALGRAFTRDVRESDALTKLSRYERGLERSFLRSLWGLQEAQRGRRKLKDIPAETR